MRKLRAGLMFGLILISMGVGCSAQSGKGNGSGGGPVTRYFQLTMVLRFPASAELEPASQSITTQVAVFGDGRTGSCRTRMTSQVPFGTGTATKFLDLGTKFDCNDVRVEGNGLAMSIVLETSRLTGMVPLKDHAGVETQEPLISSRTIALAVRLPLDTPKVIFDSKNVDPAKLKRLTPIGEPAKDRPMAQEGAMQVEMTASELK